MPIGKVVSPRGSHIYSSLWIEILAEIEVKIWLPDQISSPPVGWRSAMRRVAMLRAITDRQRGKSLL